MNTDEITNSADTLDSRNIEERIKELETEIGTEVERYDGELLDLKEELQKLQAFKEAVDSSEWECGITFINENHFEDYAREFAEDIGAIEKDYQWPANCIDWERAADELRIDYSEVDFDGVTYYYRE